MSTEKVPGVKTEKDIIERYQLLNQKVRGSLEDFYNHFIGLRLIAEGDDWQRENALMLLEQQPSEKERPAFPLFEDRQNFRTRIFESLENNDGIFSQHDSEHLQELDQLLNYADEKAKAHQLTQEVAQRIYNLLIPFLYGRENRRKIKGAQQ